LRDDAAMSILVSIALLLAPHAGEVPAESGPATLDRVTVRVERAAPASIATLDRAAIETIAATHPSELMQRLPGTWISRGSGQEQLTAIRSPVLTGTGACGAFLWSENGVPIRPAGFCNINNLFELNTDQAAGVEVLRGPGTALHGSNALHGVINVLTPAPLDSPRAQLSAEVGAHDYYRLQGAWTALQDDRGGYLGFSGTDSGSFRVDEGYRQHKLHLAHETVMADAHWHSWLSLGDLQQDTAGFISGHDAYKDPALRRSNQNPEAFRDARSLRAASRYSRTLDNGWSWQSIPYLRRDRQEFLQHFTPGQPREQGGSRSLGVLNLINRSDDNGRLALGADLEWAEGDTREVQANPLTTGSAQQQAIRPAGVHYDYRARSDSIALFADYAWRLHERGEIDLGLRVERLHFRYDNRALDGNGRDDGSACGFGGCLFNRPADRRDRFDQIAPKLAYRYRFDGAEAWLRLARGFRFPQASELYRLQRGQNVADLDSERFDMIELGARGNISVLWIEAAVYAAQKRNFIFRDANGFNESDGRTRHHGVELALGSNPQSPWSFNVNAAYAIQRYAFDRALSAGEAIVSGNEIDTAPRLLAGARLLRDADRYGRFELELVHQGGYYLDAGNVARYPGHTLAHLRWSRALSDHWQINTRLMNLADTRYAERGDYAFGEYRYFPGDGRVWFVGIDIRQQGTL
jgi:iron complex outermembrane recepter protein